MIRRLTDNTKLSNKIIRQIVEQHNLRTIENRVTGQIFGFIPYTCAEGKGEIKEELTGMTLKQLKFWLGY